MLLAVLQMRLRDLSQMPGFVNTFTETGANIFMVLQRLRLCWKEVLSCGDLLGCSHVAKMVNKWNRKRLVTLFVVLGLLKF